jgi:hypothetical protein
MSKFLKTIILGCETQLSFHNQLSISLENKNFSISKANGVFQEWSILLKEHIFMWEVVAKMYSGFYLGVFKGLIILPKEHKKLLAFQDSMK